MENRKESESKAKGCEEAREEMEDIVEEIEGGGPGSGRHLRRLLMGPHYLLSPGIRVRKEKFGLLFYNSRNTHMTFVNSGELFDVVRKEGGTTLLANPDGKYGERQIERVVETLTSKGLLSGARIGI